jgi:hypothetical protein
MYQNSKEPIKEQLTLGLSEMIIYDMIESTRFKYSLVFLH